MIDQFAQLDEACELSAAGLDNAALVLWKGLEEDFRVRVLKFVVCAFQTSCEELPGVELTTRFGVWKLTASKLERLKESVRKFSGNN